MCGQWINLSVEFWLCQTSACLSIIIFELSKLLQGWCKLFYFRVGVYGRIIFFKMWRSLRDEKCLIPLGLLKLGPRQILCSSSVGGVFIQKWGFPRELARVAVVRIASLVYLGCVTAWFYQIWTNCPPLEHPDFVTTLLAIKPNSSERFLRKFDFEVCCQTFQKLWVQVHSCLCTCDSGSWHEPYSVGVGL